MNLYFFTSFAGAQRPRKKMAEIMNEINSSVRNVLCTAILCFFSALAYAANAEDIFWDSVVKGNAREEYELYIKQYPQGRHVKQAQQAIERMRAAAQPKPVAKKQKQAEVEAVKEEPRREDGSAEKWRAEAEARLERARQGAERQWAEREAERQRTQREAERQWAEQEQRKRIEWEAERQRIEREAERQRALQEAERQRALREAEQQRAAQNEVRPGRAFKDCPNCPEMVILPRGTFLMGSPNAEIDRDGDEGPQHKVVIDYDLAVGKFEVTFDEWSVCANESDRSCEWYDPPDRGWGRGRQPVIEVTWDHAQSYVKWLSRKTGKPYRLLSEAEWEYAARAGTTTPYHVGDCIDTSQANFMVTSSLDNSNSKRNCAEKFERAHGWPVRVGSYRANAFGLHDMIGNVWEWVQDCWAKDYSGAPADGSAYQPSGCLLRGHRGGAWNSQRDRIRSASRGYAIPLVAPFSSSIGFRVALRLK